MKRKLLEVALPVMLMSGVGCASKDIAEEKKEDSVKVADYKETEKEKEKDKDKRTNNDSSASDSESGTTNKDPIATVIKDVDKIHEEKDKLEKQKKAETKKEETSKKEVQVEKKEEVNKEKDKVSDATKPNSMKEYQEKVEIQANKFIAAVKATKPIVEKDETLRTNKDELKAQFNIVKGEAEKLVGLKPPEKYSYFKIEFIDANKTFLRALGDLFAALDEGDVEKGDTALNGVLYGFEQFGMTINGIRDIEE